MIAFQPNGEPPISCTDKPPSTEKQLTGSIMPEYPPPQLLTVEGITQVVNNFRVAARNAIEAGNIRPIDPLPDSQQLKLQGIFRFRRSWDSWSQWVLNWSVSQRSSQQQEGWWIWRKLRKALQILSGSSESCEWRDRERASWNSTVTIHRLQRLRRLQSWSSRWVPVQILEWIWNFVLPHDRAKDGNSIW